MPKYSKSSLKKLSECHADLQTLFTYVIRYWNCSVICGHRGREAQDKAYKDGFSTVKWPNSRHNTLPSLAVDVVPYPIEWENTNRMRVFAGFVLGVAEMLYKYNAIDHKIKWGGDWDNDTILKDQRFNDFPHFQIL